MSEQGAVPGITVGATGSVSIVGKPAISFYRMLVLASAIKLEALGMKHSRCSMTAMAKRELGVKGNRDKVLAAVEAKIEQMRAEQNGL